MKPEDYLFSLKQICKRLNTDSVGMFYFRMMHKSQSTKEFRNAIRYLSINGKIAISGVEQRIKPIWDESDIKSSNEVLITTDLIQNIVSELKKTLPNDAYEHCRQKYGICNSESFTRKMRKMVEWKLLERDEEGYYSLPKLVRE